MMGGFIKSSVHFLLLLARMRAHKFWDGQQAEPDWEQVSSIPCVCAGARVPVEVTGERVGGGGGSFSYFFSWSQCNEVPMCLHASFGIPLFLN